MDVNYKDELEGLEDCDVVILDTEKDVLRRYYYDPEDNEGKGSIRADFLYELSKIVMTTPPEAFAEIFENNAESECYDFEPENAEEAKELANWFKEAAQYGQAHKDDVIYCDGEQVKVADAVNDLMQSMQQTLQIYQIVKDLTLEDYAGVQKKNFGEGEVVIKDYIGTSGDKDVCVGLNTSTKELYISINNGDFQSVKQEFCADLRAKIDACNKLIEARKQSMEQSM